MPGELLNVVTLEQQMTIWSVLNQVFSAVINFLYSIVITLVNFFTQPQILGALVTIAIVYGAFRMLKRKSTSL
jgi:hypothetical protein